MADQRQLDFILHDENPRRRKTGDCVIRAIAAAENRPWQYILRDMTEYLIPMGEVFDEKAGYEAYLAHREWAKRSVPNSPFGRRMTLRDAADAGLFLRGFRYIAKVRCGYTGHLTYIDGDIPAVFDKWDCRDRVLCNFWSKPHPGFMPFAMPEPVPAEPTTTNQQPTNTEGAVQHD